MKKLLKLVAASAMVLGLSLSVVSAKPSATANGSVVGSPVVNGVTRDDLVLEFIKEDKFHDVEKTTITDIDKMNSGVSISTVLSGKKVNIPNGLDFADFKLLTKIEDLDPYFKASGKRTDLENVKATWEVPNLVNNLGDVYVLHYSTVRKVWEVLKPDAVNFAKKTITCTFPDLSPVAVIYRPSAEGEGNGTKNPDKNNVKTGDNTQIALYACAGVLALAVLGTVVYKRKKED